MQLEFLSGMALNFLNPDGTVATGNLTSSGTYLTTATFTSSGNFSTVVLPSVSSSTGCGSFSNPSVSLAVLVLSLDASVSSLSGAMHAWHQCHVMVNVAAAFNVLLALLA